LISVDELRAAGALDVPAAWRKSLANESRYTLPGFDEKEEVESQTVAEFDSESGESADDLS
jgi:hypothetical protein